MKRTIKFRTILKRISKERDIEFRFTPYDDLSYIPTLPFKVYRLDYTYCKRDWWSFTIKRLNEKGITSGWFVKYDDYFTEFINVVLIRNKFVWYSYRINKNIADIRLDDDVNITGNKHSIFRVGTNILDNESKTRYAVVLYGDTYKYYRLFGSAYISYDKNVSFKTRYNNMVGYYSFYVKPRRISYTYSGDAISYFLVNDYSEATVLSQEEFFKYFAEHYNCFWREDTDHYWLLAFDGYRDFEGKKPNINYIIYYNKKLKVFVDYHVKKTEFINNDNIKEDILRSCLRKSRHVFIDVSREEKSISEIKSLLQENKDAVFTIEDSYAVGNCKPGTAGFINTFGLTGDSITARELLSHPRLDQMLEFDEFKRVIRYKMEKTV